MKTISQEKTTRTNLQKSEIMDPQMRVVFNLPSELMAQYAMMQARIKKRQAIEWERFSNYVREHFEPSEDTDEIPMDDCEPEPEQSMAEPIEQEEPAIVCKVETEEPAADELPPLVMEQPVVVEQPIGTDNLPPLVVEELPTLVETTTTENGSESGKRTVVRWSADEDEYLRELMKRFDNDFAMVAREMKTRNNRQCKSRWELLNRPADETGKKKRTKKTEEEVTSEQ